MSLRSDQARRRSRYIVLGAWADASRRTIERCGGMFEDTRNGKRRYWIDTADAGPEMG